MLIRGRPVLRFLAAIAVAPLSLPAQDFPPRHICRFVKIPMRDRVQLNTSVCEPEGEHEPVPFLITRTPYGIAADTTVPS
ncbi:MAG: hypothetical protein ABIZ96_04255, partial [Gemmatimonadales bacterium]